MIPSEELCGRCGQPYYAKSFRQAEILVCQGCHTVTLQKADFKRLITGALDVESPRAQTVPVGPPAGAAAVGIVPSAPSAPPPFAAAPSARSAPGPSVRSAPGPSVAPRSPASSVPVSAGAPGRPAARPRYDDEPSLGPLGTEETDEFARGPEAGTMAPTEIDVAEPVFDLAPAGFVQPSFHIGAPLKASPSTRSAVGAGPGMSAPSPRAPEPDDFDALPDRELPELELDVDDGFDAALADYSNRRSAAWIPVIAGVVLLGIVVTGVAGLWASGMFTASEPVVAGEVTPAAAEPTPDAPTPVAAPIVPAAVEPIPAPVTPAPVTPAPVTPAPVTPAGPAPTGMSALIKQGWTAFDRSPAEAEPLFAQALALRADHADANYGYGYALLKQGRTAEATPYLCKARDGGDAEISRDIRSLLSQNSLTCN